MNILEAMDDPALFGPQFKGGSWSAWRAFLAALFGLPMDDEALAAYRYHTGRETAPTEAFKEVALIIGRRGGKSRVLSLVAVYLALFRDYEPYLAPGEVATIFVLATGRSQARSIFRYIHGMIHAVPMLAEMVENETADTITLTNRVVIEINTPSFRVLRGYTLGAVIIDEVAFLRDENSATSDEELVKSLRPGMTTIPSSMLMMCSSPYMKKGVLYNTFARYWSQDEEKEILVWRAKSLEMNPQLPLRVIERAFKEDPVAAESEYNAAWRGDLESWCPREMIEACVVPGRYELPQMTGVTYEAGIDFSGGGADSMCCVIAHRGPDGVGVLDALLEIKGPCSPEKAAFEFAELLKRYGISKCYGDKYAGQWPAERMKAAGGITYLPFGMSKSDAYLNVLPLVRAGLSRIELLDHKTMINQFCSLERRTARGGRDSIDHPTGRQYHDDCANASALALLLVAGRPDPLDIWARLAA